MKSFKIFILRKDGSEIAKNVSKTFIITQKMLWFVGRCNYFCKVNWKVVKFL